MSLLMCEVELTEGLDDEDWYLDPISEYVAPWHSIVSKAKDKGLLEINYHNFRENAEKARHVDDEHGGGQGMLLRAQPILIPLIAKCH